MNECTFASHHQKQLTTLCELPHGMFTLSCLPDCIVEHGVRKHCNKSSSRSTPPRPNFVAYHTALNYPAEETLSIDECFCSANHCHGIEKSGYWTSNNQGGCCFSLTSDPPPMKSCLDISQKSANPLFLSCQIAKRITVAMGNGLTSLYPSRKPHHHLQKQQVTRNLHREG